MVFRLYLLLASLLGLLCNSQLHKPIDLVLILLRIFRYVVANTAHAIVFHTPVVHSLLRHHVNLLLKTHLRDHFLFHLVQVVAFLIGWGNDVHRFKI